MCDATSPDEQILASVDELAADLESIQRRYLGRQPANSAMTMRLRLADGLVRNVLRPFLQRGLDGPLHVAVVGGAGTGKSSVVNLLLGAVVAEANPQAGFTRHPVAYLPENAPLDQTIPDGLLSPLRRLEGRQPANLDEDVYQVRRFCPMSSENEFWHQIVVWDCPDVTSFHSDTYLPRVLETVSLADVVVYVASDERYNDQEPTQLLRLVLRMGKRVVCCLTKVAEAASATLRSHFQSQVLQPMTAELGVDRSRIEVTVVPFLSPQVLADPAGLCHGWRQSLLDAVRPWRDQPIPTREATVRAAVDFLEASNNELRSTLAADLDALKTWRELVERGRRQFEERYREFLNEKRFQRFEQSFVKLLELLELPGVGRWLSRSVSLTRWPWMVVREVIFPSRPSTTKTGQNGPTDMAEAAVLRQSWQAWLNSLGVEAAQRSSAHKLFATLDAEWRGSVAQQVSMPYEACLRDVGRALDEEVERTARAIYADLEQNPPLLNALRGIKLTAEASSIAAVVALGGISLWDPVLICVVTPAIQMVVEAFGQKYVDARKAETSQRQQALMDQMMARPLQDWLIGLATRPGSPCEGLEQLEQRLPRNIGRVGQAVRQRLPRR
uniref:G domain-containing protein n=1 Tax=Schlesneria paludicola TaxID=360056 RepID=A0A7C4QQ97_9PLAN